MLPDVDSLLALQRLDRQIAERQRDITALPEETARIEKQLAQHQRRLEADRAALAANQKERKQREGDIQMAEQKASKLRDQMQQAKTNEQFRAFTSEIDFCSQSIRKAEDRILELMGEAEPLEAAVKLAEGELKTEQQQVEIQKNAARDRVAEDKRFLAQLQAERSKLTATLTPKVTSLYDRLRKKVGLNIVADATPGRCTACQISVRPQLFQDLKSGDQIVHCESCGRILLYNPPVEFDAEAAALPRVRM